MSVEHEKLVLMLDRLVYAKLVEAKAIRRVFREVMKPVRDTVQNAARQHLGTDRRKAWKGVRVITLRKGAGAVVGLLNPKGSVKYLTLFQKPRGGASGIIRNRSRSDKTKINEGLYGKDRAWLLRIVNQGTGDRMAGKNGTLRKTANRGRMTAKKFFASASGPAMKQAEAALAQELGKIIDKVQKTE